MRQPLQKIGLKDTAAAEKSVARQPDQLRFEKSQAAHVLQLLRYLFSLNHLGQAHRRRSIRHRKRYLRGGEMLPDELKHQQFVEIRIQQGSHHRVEVPVVVVGPLCEVHDHRWISLTIIPPSGSSGSRQDAEKPPLCKRSEGYGLQPIHKDRIFEGFRVCVRTTVASSVPQGRWEHVQQFG